MQSYIRVTSRQRNLKEVAKKADFCHNSVVIQREPFKNKSCVSAVADIDPWPNQEGMAAL